MEPLEVSKFKLAAATGISMAVIDGLCRGDIDVTEEVSRRLGEHFSVADDFFLNLQKTWSAE
jgi:plasmid maintenance system antidote protein VapI